MNRKKRIFRLVEIFLNEDRKKVVEEYYGVGTKIKIHNLTISVTKKELLIEAVIILGNIINEDVMNKELAEVLIRESLVYIYPEHKVNTMIRWDA